MWTYGGMYTRVNRLLCRAAVPSHISPDCTANSSGTIRVHVHYTIIQRRRFYQKVYRQTLIPVWFVRNPNHIKGVVWFSKSLSRFQVHNTRSYHVFSFILPTAPLSNIYLTYEHGLNVRFFFNKLHPSP
jgi:hypothetical protein